MPSVKYDNMIDFLKKHDFDKVPKIRGKKKPKYLWYWLYNENGFIEKTYVKLPFKKRKKYKYLDSGWFDDICKDIYDAFVIADEKKKKINPFVTSDGVKKKFRKCYSC